MKLPHFSRAVKTPITTIIIPWADYHEGIAMRAFNSALKQTVYCDVVSDRSEGTPAKFRNEAAFRATTPFVTFLDADDILDPKFIETALLAYQNGKYVYSNWRDGVKTWKPRPCPWSPSSHHIVTTLYPTEIFKALRGFDERLPGHEDADFYMRSYAHWVCGIHVDETLVYRPEDSGQRSKAFHADPNYDLILSSVVQKNGGIENIMGCCGGVSTPAPNNPGAPQPGDILAETLWAGTRSEYSQETGRVYVGGNHNLIHVAPVDVQNLKDLAGRPLFKPAKDYAGLAPDRERILKDAGLT